MNLGVRVTVPNCYISKSYNWSIVCDSVEPHSLLHVQKRKSKYPNF
uniref:Uncharacterized protein n=1 Tax=Rhizophora mucronata TaxID=61149 RepID=A0A2P2PNU9_RHIMU